MRSRKAASNVAEHSNARPRVMQRDTDSWLGVLRTPDGKILHYHRNGGQTLPRDNKGRIRGGRETHFHNSMTSARVSATTRRNLGARRPTINYARRYRRQSRCTRVLLYKHSYGFLFLSSGVTNSVDRGVQLASEIKRAYQINGWFIISLILPFCFHD